MYLCRELPNPLKYRIGTLRQRPRKCDESIKMPLYFFHSLHTSINRLGQQTWMSVLMMTALRPLNMVMVSWPSAFETVKASPPRLSRRPSLMLPLSSFSYGKKQITIFRQLLKMQSDNRVTRSLERKSAKILAKKCGFLNKQAPKALALNRDFDQKASNSP